jgi:hypothetical protein
MIKLWFLNHCYHVDDEVPVSTGVGSGAGSGTETTVPPPDGVGEELPPPNLKGFAFFIFFCLKICLSQLYKKNIVLSMLKNIR